MAKKTQVPVVDQSAKLATDIAEQIAKVAPGAEVRINPNIVQAIPTHIASNLLEFLRRVQSTGMEAIAWAEAYTYVQQFVPQQNGPGIPFTGIPKKA